MTATILVWGGRLALLTLLCPTAVTAQNGWCLPDRPFTACPVTTDNSLVNITIQGDQPTCYVNGKSSDCKDLTEVYPNIETIKDLTTCKSVCLGVDDKPDLCHALTYVEGRAGQQPAECFLLSDCKDVTGVDPDSVPCDGKDEVCVGAKTCPTGSTTDCPGVACVTPQVCSEAGICVDDPRCPTPDGIDHSTHPQSQHWTAPCLLSNGEKDEPCNIYLNGHRCEEGTVCKLEPCGKEVVVTHTCQSGKWMRENVDTGDEEDVPNDDAWKDPVCNSCKETPGPLEIQPEPGLSLICLESGEPEFADGKYKITNGPCNMYCDGTYVHHIHCEDGKWKGDFGVEGEFYCWTKPNYH